MGFRQKAWNCCQDVRPGETMKGTPDNTVILHWDECQTAWAELLWRDWVRFRGFGEGGASLLAGVRSWRTLLPRVCTWRCRRTRQRDPAQIRLINRRPARSRIRWARSARA